MAGSITRFAQRKAWSIVAAGAAITAAMVARRALTAGWRRACGEAPPADPFAQEVRLAEAVAWTIAAAATVEVARLLATRGAASLWSEVTGSPPPRD